MAEDGIGFILSESYAYWNPLMNSNDAFELLIHMKFDLWHSDDKKSVAAGSVPDNMFDARLPCVRIRKDASKAARRAITIAAAEVFLVREGGL